MFGRNSSRPGRYQQDEITQEIITAMDVQFGYALAAWSWWRAVAQNVSEDAAHALRRANELVHQSLRLKDTTGMPDLVIARIHLLKRPDYKKSLP